MFLIDAWAASLPGDPQDVGSADEDTEVESRPFEGRLFLCQGRSRPSVDSALYEVSPKGHSTILVSAFFFAVRKRKRDPSAVGTHCHPLARGAAPWRLKQTKAPHPGRGARIN